MAEKSENGAHNGQKGKAPTVLEEWRFQTAKVEVLQFDGGRPFIQVSKGTQNRDTGEWTNDRIRIRSVEQAEQLSMFLNDAAMRLAREIPGAMPKHEVHVPVSPKQEA